MAAATEKDVHYVCQRCTACCRWPGDVILEDGEAERIAGFLEMEVHDFIQQHTQLSDNRRHLSLRENPDHSCVWLEGKDCSLQEVKPVQCAGFPNVWNFKGWRKWCEAIPVPIEEKVS
jgi:Fe-S-cluster containining protein